jgi:hypothetical protein
LPLAPAHAAYKIDVLAIDVVRIPFSDFLRSFFFSLSPLKLFTKAESMYGFFGTKQPNGGVLSSQRYVKHPSKYEQSM